MTRQEKRRIEREREKLFRVFIQSNREKWGVPKSQKIETKNTFGCEVSNDYIPKNQMKLLRKIGLQNIIKVKKSKKGMTSSMKQNGCHSNVGILIERYGGKQLLGYVICEESEEYPFQIIYHSVWITPKGEVIDPTLSNYETTNERDYSYFSPVFILQDDGFWIEGMNILFPNDLVKKGFYVSNTDYGGGHPYGDGFMFPIKQLCWETSLYSNLYMTKEQRIKDTYEHLHDGTGGFTEPSLSKISIV